MLRHHPPIYLLDCFQLLPVPLDLPSPSLPPGLGPYLPTPCNGKTSRFPASQLSVEACFLFLCPLALPLPAPSIASCLLTKYPVEATNTLTYVLTPCRLLPLRKLVPAAARHAPGGDKRSICYSKGSGRMNRVWRMVIFFM